MFYYMQHNSVYSSSWLSLFLPQFSHHEADQVTTRCLKCRMPGQTSTNTLFFPATVRMWNTLPAPVIQTGTLSSFKAGISNYYGHWAMSCDHRPQVCDTRPSRTALYWKMKINKWYFSIKLGRFVKCCSHLRTCRTVLGIS